MHQLPGWDSFAASLPWERIPKPAGSESYGLRVNQALVLREPMHGAPLQGEEAVFERIAEKSPH